MSDDQLNELLSRCCPPEPSPELERSVREAWRRLATVRDSTGPWWRRPIRVPAWALAALPLILAALWLALPPAQRPEGFALSDFKPVAQPMVEIIPAGGGYGPPIAR
jgi:hypothetical protein